MCRLLAFASVAPTTPVDLLADDLTSFVALSQEHADGWGMAWYDDDGELDLAKDVEPARESQLLDKLTRTTGADAMVLHLRRASPGLSVALENTHPFAAGQLAFAHNGWIRPVPELEDLLESQTRHVLRGTTDSERCFHLLLAALAQTGDFEQALPHVVERLDGRLHYTALNCVLLTEQRLYAACVFNPDEPMPYGDPDYYTVGYRVSPDAVVVGSSGCWGDPGEWEPLANGQVLVVDRGTLATTVVDLG